MIELINYAESAGGVLFYNTVGQCKKVVVSGNAGRLYNGVLGNVRGERGALVKQSQSVAHAAVRKLRNQRGGIRRQGKRLFSGDPQETRLYVLCTDAAKIEALASGENRYRNLMNLSCCKNEFHVRRRLFHDF